MMAVSRAPKDTLGVTGEQLTGKAGLALVATLASLLDLPARLFRSVRLKRRRRGCRDDQMPFSLIYSFCPDGGHLSDVDALSADATARRITGQLVVPDSRQLGEHLARLSEQALAGLCHCVRQLNRCVAPPMIRRCKRTLRLDEDSKLYQLYQRMRPDKTSV